MTIVGYRDHNTGSCITYFSFVIPIFWFQSIVGHKDKSRVSTLVYEAQGKVWGREEILDGPRASVLGTCLHTFGNDPLQYPFAQRSDESSKVNAAHRGHCEGVSTSSTDTLHVLVCWVLSRVERKVTAALASSTIPKGSSN